MDQIENMHGDMRRSESGDANRSRVLLIAYHFGPGSATGGIRWSSMAPALVDYGWEFDVVTLARADMPEGGPHVFAPGVRVFPVTRPTWADRSLNVIVKAKRLLRPPGARITPPGGVSAGAVRAWGRTDRRSAYTRLMANVSAARERVGDMGWAARATEAARALARSNQYAAVVVSSPPHLVHRVGVAVSQEHAIPFLADFRDPWTFGRADGYLSSGVDRWLAPLFEHDVFQEARVLICNTDWSRRAAERFTAGRSIACVSVPNGYDPIGTVHEPDADRFRVVFSGWLYPHMDPRPLLAACGRFRARGGPGAAALSVEFLGTADVFGSVPLESLAESAGLQGCFRLHPGTTRDKALRFQQSAAVTTAFDYPHPLAVPMKFYDQAQMRGAMLLIGNPRGALADAAAQIGLRVYEPTDDRGIDAAMAAAFERWQRRDYNAPLDARGVFARRHTIARMHDVLQAFRTGGSTGT